MALTHQEIFQRYVYAGAISRDPDAIAALFTEDGVYDAPLVPEDHPLHGRLVGRDRIRTGLGAYHRTLTAAGPVDMERSTVVLHDTTDPDVFVAEIDAVYDTGDGRRTTMSLVQMFRLRDERIAVLRDYFAASPATDTGQRTA